MMLSYARPAAPMKRASFIARPITVLVLSALFLFAQSAGAQANSLLGSQFIWWTTINGDAVAYPNTSAVYGGCTLSGALTVSAGTLATAGCAAQTSPERNQTIWYNINADAQSISFDFSVCQTIYASGPAQGCSFSYGANSGIELDLNSGGTIISATLDAAGTTVPGFRQSQITVTGSAIRVDWSNVAFPANGVLKLDVVVQ